MKDIFITPNHQILKFKNCESFWIEEIDTLKIFCQDTDKIEWNIAEFKTMQEARDFIMKIYLLLEAI